MNRFARLMLLLMLAGYLSGCFHSTQREPAEVEDLSIVDGLGDDEMVGETDDGVQTHGIDMEGEGLDGGFTPLAGGTFDSVPLHERVIYFTYDSSVIGSDYYGLIEAHASYLVGNADINITLEGHADERGSREYNLALGEYRALAVKRRMILLGVLPEQIRILSYGEERPLVGLHEDSAWSKNRRVEIVY